MKQERKTKYLQLKRDNSVSSGGESVSGGLKGSERPAWLFKWQAGAVMKASGDKQVSRRDRKHFVSGRNTSKLSCFINQRRTRPPVTRPAWQTIKGRDFSLSRADYSTSLLFPKTLRHKAAQGESILPSGISCGDTFTLGEATFLFYVNKSLGAEEGSRLSVNFDY